MFNSTDKIFIMGRSGCGKSHLAKIIQEIWPRKIIVDTLDEYPDDQYHCVYSFDEFSQFLIQNQNTPKFSLVYKFNVENNSQDIEFNEVMRLCYYFGNVLIVIEELQFFASIHDLPKWLKNCCLTGRHRNIGMLFTSQRIGEINKTVLSQCSHIFVGQMIEKNDIQYISSFLNQDSKRLAGLPERRFLYFHAGKITEISNDLKP